MTTAAPLNSTETAIAPVGTHNVTGGSSTATELAAGTGTITKMVDPSVFRAADMAALVGGFRDALRANQSAVNRLNVYPVPDGDTGTNMALTLESVVAEIDSACAKAGFASPSEATMDVVCAAISHGSLMGARGNSGVIMSQILRGLAGGCRALAEIGPVDFASALSAASTAAYGAVMKPIEGTILTVVRGAAEGASDAAGRGGSLLEVVNAAREKAQIALDSTPDLLPVLKQAGVVDAGGAGLCLLLDAALLLLDGRPVPTVEAPGTPMPHELGGSGAGGSRPLEHGGVPGIADLRYEVMYFLEAPDDSIAGFKDVWASIGDSIVVVGGDGIWNCHIHTDDIGAAIEAATDIGRPRKIRVTDLLEEVEEERWVREATAAGMADEEPPHVNAPCSTAIVAVASGDGLRRLFLSLGVQRIVTGGQSMNPSTAQLLEAVDACPADSVVILPNNKNIIAVAEQVAPLTSKSVRVVGTRGATEGLAAAMQYDPEGNVDDNATAMRSAASAVISGEITTAVRDTTSDAGPIHSGDFLGITRDGGIVVVAPALIDTATGLLDRLVSANHEIVTVIEGEGSSVATTRLITEWIADNRPGASAEVHHGGQPLYPYLFGIE
jgi:uncharacterized protein